MNKIDELAKMLERRDAEGIELFWKTIVQSSDELWSACETLFSCSDDRMIQRCLAAMANRQNARELLERIPPYNQREMVVNATIERIIALLQGTRLAIAIDNADESDPTTLVRQVVSECIPELATHFAAESNWTQGISLLSWADDCLCHASNGTNQYVPLIRDVVTRLCKHPRVDRQSVELPVLYYEGEKGYACTLHCEALVRGTGCVFPDLERMTTVAMDLKFAHGLELAWTIAKQSMKRQEPISIDIRYSVLERVSQEPKDRTKSSHMPAPLVGDSMSATLATVFSQLLAGQEIDDHWALTASLDRDLPGRLRSVRGVRAKAKAWFEKKRVNAVMLVCEKDYAEAVDGAREANIPNPEGKVEEVRNLNEVAETLKALSISRWGPIQALPELNDRFIGRENVIDRARSFIDAPESRYLVLSGGMGRGKTALMSKLIRNAFDRGERPIFHMIGQNEKAADVGESLKRQLLRKYQHEQINSTYDDKLPTILEEVNRQLTKKGIVEVIYIDAVDQLLVDGRAGEFLPGVLPRILPDRIRCIITSRFEQMWYQKARDVLFENLADHADDCKDIRLYLHRCRNALELPLTNEFIDNIVADREHPPSFFTVENCLTKCKTDDSLTTDVSPWLREPEQVIEEAAYDLVKRAESKGFTDSQVWETLGMLALASEPLSRAQLDEMGLWKVGVTDKLLTLAASFFKPVQSRSQQFVFDHPGYIRFVLAPEERLVKSQIKEIYQQLLEGCRRWDKLEQSRGYALRQLPQLLIELKNWDNLQELFRNLEYLEARIEFGGQNVAALISDFRDAINALPNDSEYRSQLKLLLEAIQRDANFLSTNPESLFQCMWNSCWWYDCPDAAMHYVSKDGPWNKGGPKLSEMLKVWLEIKSQKNPSHYWLRSLRPPMVPLGSSQVTMHRNGEAAVNSVAFHPDGDRVFGGLDNGELFIWNINSGAFDSGAFTEDGAPINCVAVSDDGTKIATGASDQFAWVVHLNPNEARSFKIRDLFYTIGSPEDREEETARREQKRNSERQEFDMTDLEYERHLKYINEKYPRPSPEDVNAAALSKDGTLLVVGVQDGSVRLFGLENRQEEHVLLGHTRPVTSVAISADSDYVASGSSSGSIIMWNLRTGQQEIETSQSMLRVNSVVFSPDSKLLVVGYRFGRVSILDVATGRQKGKVKSGDDNMLADLSKINGWEAFALSPDGKHVAIGSSDGSIQIVDFEGNVLHDLRGHEGKVRSIAFSRNGKQIVSGSSDTSIRLWDLDESKMKLQLDGHGSAIDNVIGSSSSQCVTTWHRAGKILIWDVASGTIRARIPKSYGAIVFVSPDGQSLSVAEDDEMRILSTVDGNERAVLKKVRRFLGFSPDGQFFATLHNEGIQIWEASNIKLHSVLKIEKDSKVLEGWIEHSKFSPCGKLFLIKTESDFVLWNVESGKQLMKEDYKCDVEFGCQGTQVVVSDHRRQSCPTVWEINTSKLMYPEKVAGVWHRKGHLSTMGIYRNHVAFTPHDSEWSIRVCNHIDDEEKVYYGHEAYVTGVVWSANGKFIVSGSHDRTVRLWDHENEESKVLLRHDDTVWGVAISSDSSMVASASSDGTVRLTSTKDGSVQIFEDHEGPVCCVAFSSDGKRIASGSSDQTIRIWDVKTGRQLNVCRNDSQMGIITSVAFSPDRDSRYVASICAKRHICLWDLQVENGYRPLGESELGSNVIRVDSLAYSPDGKKIACSFYADYFFKIIIWDVENNKAVVTLSHGMAPINSFAFSTDGKEIMSHTEKGVLYRWDSHTGDILDHRLVGKADHTGSPQRLCAVNQETAFSYPRRGTSNRTETYIVKDHVKWDGLGDLIATFPHHLENITECKPGRVWAGNVKNHLYLIALEGGPADT